MFQDLWGHTAKGEWQAVWSPSLMTTVSGGLWQWHSPFIGQTDNPSTFDVTTLKYTGLTTGNATRPSSCLIQIFCALLPNTV